MARNSTIRTRKIRGEDNLNGSISCAMAISAPHSTHNTGGPRRKEEGGLAAGHLWASIDPAFQRNLRKMLPPPGATGVSLPVQKGWRRSLQASGLRSADSGRRQNW